jgi:hypothetical protein
VTSAEQLGAAGLIDESFSSLTRNFPAGLSVVLVKRSDAAAEWSRKPEPLSPSLRVPGIPPIREGATGPKGSSLRREHSVAGVGPKVKDSAVEVMVRAYNQ